MLSVSTGLLALSNAGNAVGSEESSLHDSLLLALRLRARKDGCASIRLPRTTTNIHAYMYANGREGVALCKLSSVQCSGRVVDSNAVSALDRESSLMRSVTLLCLRCY